MSERDQSGEGAGRGLAGRLEDLRRALAQIDPAVLAERSGATYQVLGPGRGEFHLSLFGAPVLMSFPACQAFDAAGDPLALPQQAILAYYFHTSDGTPLSGKWVSFSELPEGRMYERAFHGYSGLELTKAFGLDLEGFKLASERAGGAPIDMGGAAFRFEALPRVPILVNYWCGDEEFPSTCKLLFDRCAGHYLPTDVCAIVGSMLTRRLLRHWPGSR